MGTYCYDGVMIELSQAFMHLGIELDKLDAACRYLLDGEPKMNGK